SRRQSFPCLLITSHDDVPNWISPVEAQKLSVGLSHFTCCETNHVNNITCVKAVTRDILNTLIDESAKYVYDVVNDKSSARGILSMRTWWVRGFDEIGVLPKPLHWRTLRSIFDGQMQICNT
ncbi:hypothetical protein OAV88_02905, partial [bacterium]|nr:hypothetical protein [bacterium]